MGHNDYPAIFLKIEELKALIRAKANNAQADAERRRLNRAGNLIEDNVEFEVTQAQKAERQLIH